MTLYFDIEVLSICSWSFILCVFFVLQTKYEVWRARSWVRDCPPQRGWNLPWWQPVRLNRPARSCHRWTSPTTRVWRTTTISKVGRPEKQGCLYSVQLIWNSCNYRIRLKEQLMENVADYNHVVIIQVFV